MADGVDLCKVALIVRSLIDETAAAEDFDIVYKTFKQSIVCTALNIGIVTQTAVRPDNLRECVFEPLREAVRLCSELYNVYKVAEL